MIKNKKILLFIVYSISVTAIMQYWRLNFGFTVMFYDVLILAFIALFFFNNSFPHRKWLRINKSIKCFIYLKWGWFFLLVASGFCLLYNNPGQEEILLYSKGLILTLIYTIFFFLLGIFYTMISAVERTRIFYFFLSGALLSCFYQFAQLILMEKYEIDIDNIIWPFLSYNMGADLMPFEGREWAGFYRAGGLLGGPNPQGILATSFLLFLFLDSKKNRRHNVFFFIIFFLSLSLTMSRSSFLAAFVSFTLFFFFEYRTILKCLKMSICYVLMAICTIGYLYWDKIIFYLPARGLEDPFRINIYKMVWDASIINPLFGHGYNTISLLFQREMNLYGWSAHNSWLVYLYENGAVGFGYQIIIMLYILYKCVTNSSPKSKALLCSYIGICIASLFATYMSLFFLQYFVAISFFTIMLDFSGTSTCPEQARK